VNITPAAIIALAQGDLENFVAASTPGGIEAQESAGQQKLIEQCQLPVEVHGGGLSLTALATHWPGFAVAPEDSGDILQPVTLPPGWQLRATSHSMWSDLLDDQNRVRARVFYKAAFYDRRASMDIVPRYNVEVDYAEDPVQYSVLDCATGEHLYVEPKCGCVDWDAREAANKRCDEYLLKHYPDHRDPFAYWN